MRIKLDNGKFLSKEDFEYKRIKSSHGNVGVMVLHHASGAVGSFGGSKDQKANKAVALVRLFCSKEWSKWVEGRRVFDV